jgi:hypothetical protein
MMALAILDDYRLRHKVCQQIYKVDQLALSRKVSKFGSIPKGQVFAGPLHSSYHFPE